MRIIVLLMLLIAGNSVLAQTGIIWSQTATVAPSHFGNMHPRVVIDRLGNPMVIWGKGNAKQVYFARWTGNGFSNPLLLNPDTIPVFAASWAGPDLAAHGDTVYVVFKETPEDTNGIYLVHSFDGGATFSGPARVEAIGDSISRFPSVATDAAGKPLVAFMKFDPGWVNSRYVVAKSDDYGNTFSPDVPSSRFSGGTVCDCCPSTLAASGNTVALLYRDNLNNLRNNWAGISFDGGSNFNEGIKVDNTDWMISSCPASGPDGVISGDQLYSVFMSAASGKPLCYRSRSNISNSQLESIEPLTGDFAGLGLQNFPRIAASDNAAAVVWKQTLNGSSQLAVQFTNSVQNGFSPGYEVLAANNVENTDVALTTGKIYVVWEATNDGTVKYKTGTFVTTKLSMVQSPALALQISPNPVDQELRVQLETEAHQPVWYRVCSITGSVLLQGEGMTGNGPIRIDVSALPMGYYWVSFQSGMQLGQAAFIRQ